VGAVQLLGLKIWLLCERSRPTFVKEHCGVADFLSIKWPYIQYMRVPHQIKSEDGKDTFIIRLRYDDTIGELRRCIDAHRAGTGNAGARPRASSGADGGATR
jgi:hypothetical protein